MRSAGADARFISTVAPGMVDIPEAGRLSAGRNPEVAPGRKPARRRDHVPPEGTIMRVERDGGRPS